MTRFIITLMAFALPFVLFWLYSKVQAKRRADGARDPWPMAVLWLTGAVLAVEALALSAVTQPRYDGVYVPSRLENGRVVPWHYEQKQAPPKDAPKKSEPEKTP